MNARKLTSYLNKHHEEMLALLDRLVNIDNRSHVKHGVDAMCDILEEEYEKLGFSVHHIAQKNCGNSAIARFDGNGRRIFLICHLDSVFPEDMLKQKGNLFRIEGNIAYGPGVVDMKACLIGCLYAIKALKETGFELPSLSVLLAGDEELGSLSITEEIKEEGKRSDFCLVTEGARPGMAVVVERKGLGKVNITAEGRGAHAGNEPEKGISALLALCDVLPRISALNDPGRGRNVLVTQLFAGEAPNVVPEKGTAYVDIRFSEPDAYEELRGSIAEILDAPRKDGAKITWEAQLVKPPMAPVEGYEELLKAVVASGNELGIEYKYVKAGGITDGNTVASVGTPTIDGMGPVGGMMCSAEEFLEVDTMVPCAARLALTIAKLK